MRIVALGGCGQEGAMAVRRLAVTEDVTSILIADLDIAKAQALAVQIGEKARAVQVDIRNPAQLAGVLAEADVVGNFVGPYFLYQHLVLKAAISAGVHYLDISDDWDPTIECLELDVQARAAGVRAILGLGVSPGVLNILARYASEKLSQTDAVHIRWAVSITDVENAGSSAAVHHALHMVEKPFPTFREGALVKVEAFSDPETFVFPLLGPQPVFNVGHPEPITLPRYIPGLKTVTQKGGAPGFNDAWQAMHALGLAQSEPVKVGDAHVSPQKMAMALMEQMDPGPEELLPPPYTELHVIVQGRRGDEEVELEYRFREPVTMGPLTGIPAYLGILWLGRNRLTSPGVIAPEGCIAPGPFLAELAEQGFVIEETERSKRVLASNG